MDFHRQDAMEFWQYLLEQLDRSAHQYRHEKPSTLLSFQIEKRTQCNASGKVCEGVGVGLYVGELTFLPFFPLPPPHPPSRSAIPPM